MVTHLHVCTVQKYVKVKCACAVVDTYMHQYALSSFALCQHFDEKGELVSGLYNAFDARCAAQNAIVSSGSGSAAVCACSRHHCCVPIRRWERWAELHRKQPSRTIITYILIDDNN